MKGREKLKKVISGVCRITRLFNSVVTIAKERKCGSDVRSYSAGEVR